MILTHGANSLGGGGDRCIFLTYFNNFDNTTKIDTPLIGEPYNMGGTVQKYTPSNLTVNGSKYYAIYTYTNDREGSSANFINGSIPRNTQYLSSEMWLYSSGTRSDFGSNIRLGVAPGITLDPYFSSTEFPISGPPLGSCDTYNLYNGSSLYYVYGGYFRFGTNIRLKTVHVAIVDDIVNKDSYYYINGNLMYVLHGANQSATYRYSTYQGNTGKEFTLTGVAIFTGNKSINSGMNYPVPDAPYDPSAIIPA